MSAGLTRCRVSSDQLHLLLSFMEEHRDFAAGKQSIYSRFSACKLWRLLAERLNGAADESGGARKTPDKWCRFWADLKYKARKKSAAGGALGELSGVEERLHNLLGARASDSSSCRRGGSHSDEDHKPTLDEDMYSEGSGAGGAAGAGAGEGADGARLATEELLAEAAMRSALAAEKQAEAVTQAVELLRDLVSLLRERPPPLVAHAMPPHAAPHAPPHAPPDHGLAMQHHHHRL